MSTDVSLLCRVLWLFDNRLGPTPASEGTFVEPGTAVLPVSWLFAISTSSFVIAETLLFAGDDDRTGDTAPPLNALLAIDPRLLLGPISAPEAYPSLSRLKLAYAPLGELPAVLDGSGVGDRPFLAPSRTR